MAMRRVVTGQRPDGKSVLVSDALVEPLRLSLMPGYEFASVWGADGDFALPSDGAEPAHASYFPPPGGFRFSVITLPPDSAPGGNGDAAAGMREAQEKLPGLLEHIEPDHPGFHTTDTVDLDIILDGELWLELDDGAEIHLRRGDCVIQNGTRHAWRNKSSQPCTMLSALVGVQRRA